MIIHKSIDILEFHLKEAEKEFEKTSEATQRKKYYNLEDDIKDIEMAIRILNHALETYDIYNSAS